MTHDRARDAATSPEPLARGVVFHAFRESVLAQYGRAGIASMSAHLTPASSRALEDGVLAHAWRPERLLMDWHEAVWRGPLREDDAALRTFVGRSIASGVNRTRRALLRFMSPVALVRRAALQWQHDHTRGVVVIDEFDDSPCFLQVKVIHQPYFESSVARAALAESLRYVAAMSGARDVRAIRAAHYLEGRDVFTLKLGWND